MDKLIARHRMRSVSGDLYLVNEFEDGAGHTRMELSDGSPVQYVRGMLYRIERSAVIIRLIGSDAN
jgi:hypothetical protein